MGWCWIAGSPQFMRNDWYAHTMLNRENRQMPSASLRLDGHLLSEPSGVFAQSVVLYQVITFSINRRRGKTKRK